MDLRRGNRAPSPRLVALLEAGRESRAADPCGDRNSASEPARESAADPAGTAVAWAPSRADILAAATAGAERAAVDSAADRGERGGRHRRQVRDLEEAPRPAPLTVPGVLRGGRYAVSAQVLVGLVAVVLVVVAVLGVRVWLAQRASVPHAATGAASQRPAKAGAAGDERSDAAGEVAVSGGSPTAGVGGKGSPGEPGSASPPGAAAGAPGAGGKVVVHVTGQVRRPGIVTLAATDRVADAIEKAGGVKSPADTAAINLAQVVSDGQQIVVPKPGVPVAAPNSGASNSGGSAGGSDAGGAGGALVDLNAADQSMLEELPGIGPVLAERIIEWRTQQGRFTAVEELQEVTGIGEKLYAQISPKVRV